MCDWLLYSKMVSGQVIFLTWWLKAPRWKLCFCYSPISEAMQSIFSTTIWFQVFTSLLKFNRRVCWRYLSMEGMSRNFGVSFTTLYTWVGIAYWHEQHKNRRIFVGRMSQIRFRNFKTERSVWFLVSHNVQKFYSSLGLRMDIEAEVKLWENALGILSHESDEIVHRHLQTQKSRKSHDFFLKGVFQNSNEGSISRRKLAMQT